jgi:hypothetical protein
MRFIVFATIAGLGMAAARSSLPVDIDRHGGDSSGYYSLAASVDGRAYLSWIEPMGARRHSFKFSTFERGRWSSPLAITTADNFFVNWGDHPSIAVLPDGVLVAHWLVNNDVRQGPYGYGLRIAESRDHGVTWRQIFKAGTDNLEEYSGFVSVLPGPSGWSAAYLTPFTSTASRVGAHHEASHMMTLKVAQFASNGDLLSDTVVDSDVCSCCNTSIAQTDRGPIIAYRDHRPGEIRDISVVRYRDGRWTDPRPVSSDGWVINACPSNGPSIDAVGNRVAVAWFTAAYQQPHVKLAFSDDTGDDFQPPLQIDGGKPVGWPRVVMLDDGGAVVCWLEATEDGRGEVRLRRVWADRRVGEPIVVASAAAGRSTGEPQLVRMGASVMIAWRSGRVRTSLVPIPTR